jgi:hypothetical protein
MASTRIVRAKKNVPRIRARTCATVEHTWRQSNIVPSRLYTVAKYGLKQIPGYVPPCAFKDIGQQSDFLVI